MCRGIKDKLLAVVLCTLVMAGMVWASEGIIYVDAAATGGGDGSSWADAYPDLQDALTVAIAEPKPLEIRVAQGVYRPEPGVELPSGSKQRTFILINGVTLKGGYAGSVGPDPDARDFIVYETILGGDYDETSSDHGIYVARVVTGNLTDETAVLDGFTITNGLDGISIDEGSPTLRNLLLRDNRDGLDINNGSPSLTNCTFFGNDDGIYAWDCNSVLTNCVFERNDQGANFARSNPVLMDCTFYGQKREAVGCNGILNLHRCSFQANGGFRGTVTCNGTVMARQCTFTENYAMPLRCSGDNTIIDCQFINNSAGISEAGAIEADGYTFKATRCVFVGNASKWNSGAINNFAINAQISQCVFVGNTGGASGAGAIRTMGYVASISNCTFAGNRGTPTALECPSSDYDTKLTNCIVWDGPDPFTKYEMFPPTIQVDYSNVQGGYEGTGNIDVEPEFVMLGYWADPEDRSLEIGPDDPNAVWVMGDYHLKSQAGHWDVNLEDWVYDDVTSPCLDAGDPNGSLGDELFPNGGYANLGAYGSTTQASRTYFGGPVCPVHLAGDINGDCVVDQLDMDILLSQWLVDNSASFNILPTITIVSPQDGAVITSPEPIILAFDVSDSDGRVLKVNYSLRHEHGNGEFVTSSGISGPRDVWEREHDWLHIKYDGLYTIQAEAVDDNGARTAAAEITVTLHPGN